MFNDQWIYGWTKKFKKHIAWDKKTRIIEINKVRHDTKRKLNMLDDKISNISENLNVELITLILKCEIFKNFERERE